MLWQIGLVFMFELFYLYTHKLVKTIFCVSDGYTYEKSAIESWFLSGKLTSPMTNKPVPVIKLKPNIELKGKINKYLLELQKD